MAVIQKIRDRYAKLAGLAIALSLVAFIVSEGINGSFASFFGRDTSVAKVNGDKIDVQEYGKTVQEYQSLTELFRKGQPMTETDLAQMRQSVLEQMVSEKLIEKEAKKLGLVVSEAEKKDMFYGNNPDPAVQQFPYFAGQSGQFDPQNIKAFEREVKKDGSEQAMKALAQWEALKTFLERSKLVQKYNALIANATYTPKFMLTRSQQEQTMQAGIRYVKIPYTSVSDNEVKVSDADLTEYMNKHKAQYETDQPSRSIEYVVYAITPDAQDTAKALNALNKIHDEFATASDNEKFVTRNSDDPYVDAFVTKKTLMSAYTDTIFNQPVGGVFGPYFENDNYKLTKIVTKMTLPDSVKFRHILIKTEDQGKATAIDSNVAKARIDSIATAIAGGADFKAMVTKYSDDAGSKTTGGEYDFNLQQRASTSKELADFIFEGKTGEKKVVKVGNSMYAGYHYVEILSQKDPVTALKIATITKGLITSGRSSNAILSKANEFAGRNNNATAFDAAVKKEMLNKRVAEDIKPGDFVIQGLGPARELIRWVYDAKDGDVSNPLQLEKNYVVAKVSGIQEKGLRTLNTNLRAQLEGLVKAEKKAKMIADKYKSMQSLEAIAQAAGQTVVMADSLKGNASFTPALGYEPKVIGYAFYEKLQPNTLSPALKGKDGVFFISLIHRNQVTTPGDQFAQQQQQMMEAMQTKNYIGSMLPEAIRKNGSVTYNPKNIN